MRVDRPGVDPDWVVVLGAPTFPEQVVDAAVASHATLAQKLSALRSLMLEFPGHPGPAAADRWIDGPAAADRWIDGPAAADRWIDGPDARSIE